MKHNMGKHERVIRLIVGALLFLIGWGFWSVTTPLFGLIIAILGAGVLITGLIAWCPVSALFHRNSCEACKVGETHWHFPV